MLSRLVLGITLTLSTPACVVVDDSGGSDPGGSAGSGGSTGSGSGSGSGDSDTGSSDSQSSIEPASGIWGYTEYTPITNDCDFQNLYGSDGGFRLDNHGDGSFLVTPGDGSEPFDCFLDGADFNCPDRGDAQQDLANHGLDAVIYGAASARGSFLDSTTATGEQIADITCEGSDCPKAEAYLGTALPCTFRVSFDVALEQKL